MNELEKEENSWLKEESKWEIEENGKIKENREDKRNKCKKEWNGIKWEGEGLRK